jgi:hypothetical protein
MSAVDADMVLVAKGRDRDIGPLCAVLGRLGLPKLDRPTRIAVLLAQFRGFGFPSLGGMQPSLIAFFLASVLRCFGAATIVASRKPAWASAASKRLNKISIAGLPSTIVRVSALRKFQIEFASGTQSASVSPRNRMNDKRSLIRYSVCSSESEWLACRIRTLNIRM